MARTLKLVFNSCGQDNRLLIEPGQKRVFKINLGTFGERRVIDGYHEAILVRLDHFSGGVLSSGRLARDRVFL